MIAGDSVMVPLALICAFALHYAEPFPAILATWWLYPVAVGLTIPIFGRLGLYRAVVRFMGPRAVFAVLQGVTLMVLLFGAIAHFLAPATVPSTALVMFWGATVLYVGGSRFAVRSYLQRQHRRGERVAVYGAGGAGARLASALVGGQEFLPVAFVDDSVALHGSVINGIEVFNPADLPRLVNDLEITRVLLALPSVSRRRRMRIISQLEDLHVHIQTMPNFSDLISGNARVDEIRDVDVADLLGRDTVPPHEALLDACIRDKVIMVTGAGGSIGSELCRQIVRLGPKRLLLVEHSELALYDVNKELSATFERDGKDNDAVDVVPLLGSVENKERMTSIMTSFGVQTVYHAAAYKHVPMVEQNMLQGVHNNVFGTYHTALAAMECNVETFVLVSTDKAVCPTNVMGATKRLAEMVLQGLDDRGTSTRFCMVRFGNVLESSGSVVPLFREQIRRGGPVTVTHPEIIRYFMTIPEAAQLVIQAGSLGRGGDVFVLDMGKPVKIADLAKRMVHLMGLTVMSEDNPDGDIEIKYTGLRPAEKLYEELLIGNNVMGTKHPMIMRAEEQMLPWERVSRVLDELRVACRRFDCESARHTLMAAVNEYKPSSNVVDLVWQTQEVASSDGAITPIANVTPLSSNRTQ
ncbi:MAG: nucleoside-diphosphate sugar epimerase/dehydratase [Pseudomonadota bacterium]